MRKKEEKIGKRIMRGAWTERRTKRRGKMKEDVNRDSSRRRRWRKKKERTSKG